MARTKKIKAETITEAFGLVAKEFLAQNIALALQDPSLKEINYIKTAATLPNGGVYLVSILHIEGAKLSLDELRVVKKSQEEK